MLNPLLAIESMWPARCLLLSESLVWCRMVTAESEYVCVGMNAHIRPKEQVAHWQLWETLRSACKHLKCPNASGRRIPSTTSRLSGHTIFQKHFPWCLLLGWNTLAMWKRKKKKENCLRWSLQQRGNRSENKDVAVGPSASRDMPHCVSRLQSANKLLNCLKYLWSAKLPLVMQVHRSECLWPCF